MNPRKKKKKKMITDEVPRYYKKKKKKSPTLYIENINNEVKNLMAKLGINDKVNILYGNQAFLMVNDHKDDFLNSPSFRLIKTTETELDIVNQRILQKVCNLLRVATQANQWKGTNERIAWFHGIKNKDKCVFIKYDIKDCYDSISKKGLLEALAYTINIPPKQIHMILNFHKSIISSW